MAKVTLRQLEDDLRRWLFTGDPATAAARGIPRYRQAIEAGSCTAALARAAPLIDALAHRSAPDAAALLELAARVAQIRGRRAAPARAEGDLTALMKQSTLETPLPDAEAHALIEALNGRGADPTAVIVGALERGAIVDLRVLRWIAKIVDGWVDDETAINVACAFGADAAAKLEADFNPRGGREDELRLRIIAAIRGHDAIPLVGLAYVTGARELRAIALEEWARIEPDAALRAAFEALDEHRWDREFGVWRTAIRLVARSRDRDAALEALLGQLPFVNDSRAVLSDALAAFEHPELSSRLHAVLADAMAVITEETTRRNQAGRRAPEDEQSALDRYRREQRSLRAAWNVASVAGARLTPDFEDALFAIWCRRELDWNVREGIGSGLLRTRREDIRASIIAEHQSQNFCLRDLALKMVLWDPERSFESARPFFTASALAASQGFGLENAKYLLQMLMHRRGSRIWPLDPRWSEHLRVAIRFRALERDARFLLEDCASTA